MSDNTREEGRKKRLVGSMSHRETERERESAAQRLSGGVNVVLVSIGRGMQDTLFFTY